MITQIVPSDIDSNNLFYSYPAYDAIDFEIQSMLKLLENFKKLFEADNKKNEYGTEAIEARERKILKIMLLNKVVHYMETLGAVSLAILATKSEKYYERYNKNDEKEKFISGLSSYNVGDVVNFYRDIKNRSSKYLYRLLGYPPSVFQTDEINAVLEESCKNISMILSNIGNYYSRYINLYNAYKHGYRIVIPDKVNGKEGLIIKEENNKSLVCYFEDNDVVSLQQLTTNCRGIIELIHENNKKTMYVENSKTVKLELKTIVGNKFTEENKSLIDNIGNMNLYYPTTEEEKKSLIEEQDTILKKTTDVSKYNHKFVLIDLDQEKIIGSAKSLNDVTHLQRNTDSPNRTLTLKITTSKLRELGLST